MRNKVKAWFAPPIINGDAELMLQVNLLNANMIFISIYVVLVVVSFLFGAKMSLETVVFDSSLFFVIQIFRYWLFRGKVQAAGVGLLVSCFIVITLVIISMGTATSPATDAYVLVVIMAGVFFRQRGVIFATIITSLAVLGLILAERAGMLPVALEFVVVPQWLTYTLVFLVSGSLINYAMQTMRNALDALKKENEERKQASILQETVYRIAEATQSAESLQDLYPLIHNHISSVMYAHNFYIALYDEVTDLLGFAFSRDEIDDEYFPPYPPTKGLTAYVLKSGSSLLCWPERQTNIPSGIQFFGLTSAIWLGVPLVIHGKTIGVMAVQHYSDPGAYTERDQRMLEFVSSQVATAIDRKRTEEKLRDSNERFRQIAENIEETFWIWDREKKKIDYISPAFNKLWGMAKDLPNKDSSILLDAVLPEDRPIVLTAFEDQNNGHPTEIRIRIQRTDGAIRWIWDRSFPICDEGGKLVGNAGVATDITEVKTAEDELEMLNRELEKRVEVRTTELRRSEETFRALFENSNDGIFLLSTEGEHLQANQRALEMVGYSQAEYEVLERNTKNGIVTPEDRDDSENKITEILRGGVLPLYERVLITKDGRKINTEINLSAVRDDTGKVIMLQSVVRDITLRKKAEEALRQSRDDLSAANLALEKASRLKDEFLASMSHELRTPLTGILGLSEALQMQTYGSLSEKQLRALKNIENSGRHLLDLINDILDLSKIEANKLELQPGICLVDDICTSSLQLTKGMSHQKKQNVKFSSNVVGAVVYADARRFKQMVVNLLSNAIKFTPEGGSLGLDVNGSEEEQVILLTVWDNGIGIKPEDISRLFKPFIQLDASLSRQYSGTGLGLSLVDRLAKMHGGSVSVESKPGEGSRFTIRMPWNSKPIGPDKRAFGFNVESREQKLITFPARPERGTILFADDNDVTLNTFSDFLQANAYKMILAHDGLELVRLAPTCAPDLIMADIQMPGMSGLQAIELIRGMDDDWLKKVPIIAITALVMPGDEERCIQAGANKYISKPVSLNKLLETLESMISAFHK